MLTCTLRSNAAVGLQSLTKNLPCEWPSKLCLRSTVASGDGGVGGAEPSCWVHNAVIHLWDPRLLAARTGFLAVPVYLLSARWSHIGCHVLFARIVVIRWCFRRRHQRPISLRRCSLGCGMWYWLVHWRNNILLLVGLYSHMLTSSRREYMTGFMLQYFSAVCVNLGSGFKTSPPFFLGWT